jgi:capsular exopolysaccharide synthesis family protein
MAREKSKAVGKVDSSMFALELRDVWRAVRRRPWILVLSVLVTSALVWGVSTRQKKVYQAVATVVLDPHLPKVLGEGFEVDDPEARGFAKDTFFNTQYKIMRSRAVLREAIARLHLDSDATFLEDYGIKASTQEERSRRVERALVRMLEIAPERKTDIVRLVVEDYDADRAARIANEVTQVYIDQSLERRLSTTRNASKWLDERVDEFSKKLDESEKALQEYKKNNMLVSVSVEDRKNMTTSNLQALNAKLIDVRSQLLELQAERAVLDGTAKGNGGDVSTVPRVRANEVVGGLKATLVELGRQRADLASRYGEKHPNMVAVDNQIQQVSALLAKEISLIVGTLDNEIQKLVETQVNIEAEMKTETKKAMELNDLAIEYARLSRDVGTNEETYQSLLKRQTETDLSGLLESNFVRWLETAEPKKSAIRPSVPINTLLGAILGLLIAMFLAIGEVVLDNTVHTQVDVEERLGQVFLGLLPAISKEELAATDEGGGTVKARDLFIHAAPQSSVAECARSLRTNLLFLDTADKEHQLRRILLTSPSPAEGKSMTAIILGTTMAQAGSKTLIIDTDLRKPRLHNTFGVSSEQGVTSVLLESCTLEAAIKTTEVVGLDVLPCGPRPPNPAELLHSEGFKKLLDDAAERYDRVLLDSPPINAVTDPIILSKLVDGTIVVVKSSKTTKDAARRAVRQLEDVNAKVLGVVLNDVDFKSGGYYDYRYNYYYNRSYGSDEEPAKA